MSKKWFSKKYRTLAGFFASGLLAVGLSLVPVDSCADDIEVNTDTTYSAVDDDGVIYGDNFIVSKNGNDPQTVSFDSSIGAIELDGTISGEGNFAKIGSGKMTINSVTEHKGTSTVKNGDLILNVNDVLAESSGLKIEENALVKTGVGPIDFEGKIAGVKNQNFKELNGNGILVGGTIENNSKYWDDDDPDTDMYIGSVTTFNVEGGNFFGAIIDNKGNLDEVYVYNHATGENQGDRNVDFGTAALQVDAGKVFTLSGSDKNTYSGNTTVAGVLRAGANNAFSANSDHVLKDGGLFDLQGTLQSVKSLSGYGNVALGDTGEFRIGNDYNLDDVEVFTGEINGDGKVFIDGAANFGGTNQYTGETLVSENGKLLLSASKSIDRSSRVRLEKQNGSEGEITIAAGTEQNFQELYSTNGGIVNLETELLGNSPDQVASGAKLTVEKIDFNGWINLKEKQIANPGTENEYTVFSELVLVEGILQKDSTITGEGAVRKVGPGTLTILGSNIFGGGFYTDGGVVEIGNDNALGAFSGDVAFNNGEGDVNVVSSTVFASLGGEKTLKNVFHVNSEENEPQTLFFDTTEGKITLENGERSDTDIVITGNGNLAKIGDGTLEIGAKTDYTGVTFVQSGILKFSDGNHDAIEKSIRLEVSKTGVLDIGETAQTIQSGVIEGGLRGSGTLIKDGNDETLFVLSENAGFEGRTWIDLGTVAINNGFALGSKEENTISLDGGTLRGMESFGMNNGILLSENRDNTIQIDDGKTVHLYGAISNAGDVKGGSFVKSGGGTLIVDNAVNDGITEIQEGILQAGYNSENPNGENALSADSLYLLQKDTVLDLGGRDQTVAAIIGSTESEVRLGNGTLRIGDDDGLDENVRAPFVVYDDNDISVASYRYDGTISGNNIYHPGGLPGQNWGHSGIEKIGNSIWELGGINTYTGETKFSGGTIVINRDENLGNGGDWVFNGGTLLVNGSFENDRNIYVEVGTNDTLSNGLNVSAGETLVLNGVISDRIAGTLPGQFNKLGGGTLILGGGNTNRYTNVQEGTVIGNTGSLQGHITLEDETDLFFEQWENGIFNYRASGFGGGFDQFQDDVDRYGLFGTGRINKIGDGILEIVTDNSLFEGTTNIWDGVLRVGKFYENDGRTAKHTGSLGGDVIVSPASDAGADYAILSGNGTIGGDVTITSGGILAPGNMLLDEKYFLYENMENFGRDELGLKIGGDLQFVKTGSLSEDAGNFVVGISNRVYQDSNLGVSDFIDMSGAGSVRLAEGIPEVTGGYGQLPKEAVPGTRLEIVSFSDRCEFLHAYGNEIRYRIIDNATNIDGDFTKLYDAYGNPVLSKDLDQNGLGRELLDVNVTGIDYLPRFLGFSGENNETHYDLILGRSDWDFTSPIERQPVYENQKPLGSGSHNQGEVGASLNCVLEQISSRYDPVNGSWNTLGTDGIWHNPSAYRDSLWSDTLCHLGNPDISATEYREMYDQLAGDIKASGIYMGLNRHYRNAFNHLAFDPFYCSGGPEGECGGSTCGDVSCGEEIGCGTVKNSNACKTDFWFDGEYIGGRFNSDGNAQGFDMNGGGFTLGLGKDFGCRKKLGITLGYTHPEISGKFGKSSLDDFTIGVYGGLSLMQCFDLKGYLGAGIHDYKTNRSIYSGHLVDAPTNLRSGYKGSAFEASGEIGVPLTMIQDHFWLRPYLGISYKKAWQDATTESGHDIYALEFAKSNMDQLFFTAGLGSEVSVSRCLSLRGKIAWEYQALGGGKHPEQWGSFIGGNAYPCGMNVHGLEMGKSRFTAGAGAEWYFTNRRNASLAADYEIDSLNRGTFHNASLGIRVRY